MASRAWRLLSWRILQKAMRLPGYQLRRKAFFAIQPLLRDPAVVVTARADNGRVFELDLADEIDAEIFLFRGFDPETSAVAQSILRRGDCAIDAGANVGYFSLAFATAVGGRGTVVAFEPSPITYTRLARNVALNKATNVVLRQAALGERPERTVLVQRYRNRSSTATVASGIGVCESGRTPANFAEYEVQILTLDDYCSQHRLAPALVKIDVEGAELSVLRGATDTLRKARPVVIVEFAAANARRFGYTVEELCSWLSDEFGYRFSFINRSELRPVGYSARLSDVNQNAVGFLPGIHDVHAAAASRALADAHIHRRDFEVWPERRLTRRPRRSVA